MSVGGCGGSARDATAEAKPSVALYSEGAAAAVADALLAAVPLPSDTQRVSEPPRAVAGKLGRPINSEDSAKAVDRYAYWASTDRPEAILSFIAKRGPIHKVAYSSYGGTAGPDPSCPAMAYANTEGAPRFRLTFRASASAPNLARVIGVSGHVCERGGAHTAKITTPEDPQGLQLTDHLNAIGPSKGECLTEHIELAFHHSLQLVSEYL
jgi:hypothetical protein